MGRSSPVHGTVSADSASCECQRHDCMSEPHLCRWRAKGTTTVTDYVAREWMVDELVFASDSSSRRGPRTGWRTLRFPYSDPIELVHGASMRIHEQRSMIDVSSNITHDGLEQNLSIYSMQNLVLQQYVAPIVALRTQVEFSTFL